MNVKAIIIFILFKVFLFSGIHLKAATIDSLKSIKPKNLSDKINHFTLLGWEYRSINLDSAFYYAFKANRFVNKHSNKEAASYNFHILGALYAFRGEYQPSYMWLHKAYLIRKQFKNKEELLVTLINLVYACQGLGDVKKMHPLAIEAEKLAVDLNKVGKKIHLTTLCQLSDVYGMLKRQDKAEEYLKIAVKEAEAEKSDYNKAVIYHNYGTFLLKLFKYKDALVYFEKAIPIVKKLNDESWLYDLNFNLGIVYAESGDLDKAEAVFLESYKREMNKPKSLADNYARSLAAKNLGYVVLKKHDYVHGLKYMEESLLFAKKAGASDLMADRYMSISEALEGQQKFEKALQYRKIYENLKDSIFNLETAKQLNELSEKFDTEKKEKRILLLKKRNAEIRVKQLESKRELGEEKAKSTRRNVLFASLILIVLLVASFIYYSLVQKRKAHVKLEEKNRKIELQHLLLEEKQKEVIDSINYAKRIQDSLLPAEKYVAKNLERLKSKSKG